MDGKDSLQSAKQKTPSGLTSTQTQHLDGLLSNHRKIMEGITPNVAFNEGFVLHTALKARKAEVKVLLLAELERLTRHLNATRTFQTQTDLQDAVDDICEVFPTLKLEEILTCFKYIRQGRYQLFGNFTTNVLMDCLRQYEDEHTTTIREKKHRERKQEVLTAQMDLTRLIEDLNKSGKLKPARRVLDKTFIPYPNAKEDYYEAQARDKEETKETHRPEGDEEGSEGSL